MGIMGCLSWLSWILLSDLLGNWWILAQKDEFVEKAYFILGCEDSDIYCKETIKEIAEQLKAGGDDV